MGNSAGEVRVESRGAVCAVTLSSPGKLNALSEAMWQQLAAAFIAISDRADLRAVTLRGADGNFAAGADIDEFERLRFDADNGRRYHLQTIGNALTAIDSCPLPVVAIIDGVCIGGGLEIATVCDLRLAAEDARIGVPIGRLGFPLALPELVPLLRLVSPAVAAELLIEGRILSGVEAAARGLVTRAVPGSKLNAEVERALASLCAGSPRAARENKRNIRQLMLNGLRYTDQQLHDSFAFLDSPDYHEGVRAFVAKRSPQFSGQ